MRVIMDKIIQFFYVIELQKWPQNGYHHPQIIKELYLNYSSPTKKLEIDTKSPIQGPEPEIC